MFRKAPSLLALFITVILASGFGCSTAKNTITFGGAPDNVRAAAGDSTVILSWNGLAGASTYRIYWNTTGGVSPSDQRMETSDSTYTHAGLTNGATYYYKVSAVANNGSESALSVEFSGKPFSKPATPTGLAASTSSGQVTLSWQAAAKAEFYKLYWNTTGNVTGTSESVRVDGLSYTHAGLTNGQPYFYRISAATSTGESDMSAEISATPSASGGGGSSGGGGGGGGGSISCANGVPTHPGAAWSVADCGPFTYGSGNGYFFNTGGSPSWASGRVTFKLTGLDEASLTSRDFFLFFAKMITPNGNEGNFQIDLFNDGTNNARIISQRFDGTCSKFCEHQDVHTGVAWNPSSVYYFDIEWNTSSVNVTVTESGSGNVMMSGSVPTDGAYARVDYIGAGNSGNQAYPGINADLTFGELRLSTF